MYKLGNAHTVRINLIGAAEPPAITVRPFSTLFLRSAIAHSVEYSLATREPFSEAVLFGFNGHSSQRASWANALFAPLHVEFTSCNNFIPETLEQSVRAPPRQKLEILLVYR